MKEKVARDLFLIHQGMREAEGRLYIGTDEELQEELKKLFELVLLAILHSNQDDQETK